MDRDIRHAALRAAAKLVFFSVALGCGSTGLIENGNDDIGKRMGNSNPKSEAGAYEPGPSGSKVDASNAYPPDAHATRDAQASHDANTVNSDSSNGALSDQQCTAVIKELFANPDGNQHNFDAGDPQLATADACCDRFLREAWNDGGVVDWEVKGVRAECCTLEDWDATYPAYTPWGPPVPPAMSDSDALGVA